MSDELAARGGIDDRPVDEPDRAAQPDAAPGPDPGSDSLALPYRVRFDEATPAGGIRTSVLLRYAQDCAWAHSEARGLGRDWYWRRGLFWLVRAVELRVVGTLAVRANATVTTTVVGFRRVLARRRTTVDDADGAPVAVLDTDWAMIDAAGVPTRIPPEFAARFAGVGERFAPNRVVLGAAPADAVALRFAARAQELDPMGHANNATYLDWLEEAAAVAFPELLSTVPRTYRLEYLLPAVPGAQLEATAWRSDSSSMAYRLTDGIAELLRATIEG